MAMEAHFVGFNSAWRALSNSRPDLLVLFSPKNYRNKKKSEDENPVLHSGGCCAVSLDLCFKKAVFWWRLLTSGGTVGSGGEYSVACVAAPKL